MSAETIPALLAQAADRSPDATWLLYEDEGWTFAEAVARVGSVAAALRELGLRPGSLCLATARNSPEFLFLWLAAAHIGALYFAVDPRARSAELRGWLDQTTPALAITDADAAAELDEAIRASGLTVPTVDVSQLFGERLDPPRATADPDKPAFLIATSGTTGRSKLVMHSQRSYVLGGEGFPYWLSLTQEDRLITCLPLFHINATVYSTLGSLAAGASLVLLPRFSAGGFLDSARKYGATQFNSVGAMLEILMRQPERPDDADTPLKLCYSVPTPTRERQNEIEQRLGLELVTGYALTESPYGMIWKHGTKPYGTVGSPRQHPTLGAINEVRIVNRTAGGSDELGELELRNTATMLGYYGSPLETGAVLVDGWLRTGDLVRDNRDGTYTFVARIKEVIRRRGENLSPSEVEAVLELHPAVSAAAVVGVPSALSDEDVKAFVVLEEDETVLPHELREWTLEHLTPFKAPRYIEFVEVLPYTATGRVEKHKLSRERTAGEWDAEAAIAESA